ncbi:hypothetical protein [Bacillus toyonensis]|uniref:hypothetical protein n=1 Tax=Bacillus toyonensis TaxID=155322 RepID=UPI00211E0C71|nr:hypothetical protein [Bacillus toyonensis]
MTLDSLHMKLNRLKNSDVLNGLIKEGKERGKWIFTVEAMEVLYPKKGFLCPSPEKGD